MRILYGICGEGMGHASIASEVIPFLESKGHVVKVISYGKGIDFLKEHDVLPIRGFRFAYKDGGVQYLQSVYANAVEFPKNFLKLGKIMREVEAFNPDLCITDNEPVVAWISYAKNLPLVSFSALNSFVHHNIKIPLKYEGYSIIAKTLIRSVVPKANACIALSIFERGKRENVIFTSPIIRSSVRKRVVKKEDFILAYIAKSHDYLLETFAKMNENFVVYGSSLQKKEKNITYKKNHEEFAKDMSACKAIISNAGFSVLAESIYLRKPIFMIPVRKQYEQYYNSVIAQNEKIGVFSEKPNEKELRHFFSSLELYEDNMKNISFEPKEPLLVLEKTIEEVMRRSAPDRI